MPLRLLDEAVDHTKSEASTSPLSLCRKKGLEDVFEHVCRHSTSCIGNRQEDIVARRHIYFRRGIKLIEVCVSHLDRERAAIWHRIACIDGKVEDDILDLRAIDEAWPRIPSSLLQFHGYLFSEGPAQ